MMVGVNPIKARCKMEMPVNPCTTNACQQKSLYALALASWGAEWQLVVEMTPSRYLSYCPG